ncbi:hypothetical protein K439DRAFT_1632083 [Ramaria rubella]|nr:hypothetical protein K439DRAFT_1632083 [Ramaria rubella]
METGTSKKREIRPQAPNRVHSDLTTRMCIIHRPNFSPHLLILVLVPVPVLRGAELRGNVSSLSRCLPVPHGRKIGRNHHTTALPHRTHLTCTSSLRVSLILAQTNTLGPDPTLHTPKSKNPKIQYPISQTRTPSANSDSTLTNLKARSTDT